MTLNITLLQISQINIKMPIRYSNSSKLLEENKKVTLMIQTSKIGALLPAQIKFNRVDWTEKFSFQVSAKDKAQFILIEGGQNNANNQSKILGKKMFFGQKFVKMFEKELQKSAKQKKPFQYKIQLFQTKNSQTASKQVEICTIKMNIQYNPYLVYEGQFVSKFNLDLRPSETEKKLNAKFVKFYQGKCQKINFFSWMDDRAKDQKFRFLQSIYQDLE